MVAGAIAFLVLSIARLAFIKPEDEPGDWINGLHGLLAWIIPIRGLHYAQKAWRELKGTASPGAVGSA